MCCTFCRYAGEAGNYSLVMFAARHFWNACLPLLGSPRYRKQLKEPTEIILKSIIKAESKNKQVRISVRYCYLCLWLVIGSDDRETIWFALKLWGHASSPFLRVEYMDGFLPALTHHTFTHAGNHTLFLFCLFRRRRKCCLCTSGVQRIFKILGYQVDAFSKACSSLFWSGD